MTQNFKKVSIRELNRGTALRVEDMPIMVTKYGRAIAWVIDYSKDFTWETNPVIKKSFKNKIADLLRPLMIWLIN